MIWYIEDPLLSRKEREALDALASGADWLIPGEWRVDGSLRLNWDANILINDRRFPVSLRYPNHFPHSPPLVLPRGETERWSSHQYGAGGELCLEFGPDNWHPDITGADMMQSAYRLLAGERPAPEQRGRVASRHATTLGQDLRGDRMRLLITAGLAALAADMPEGEILQGTIIGTFRGRSVVYVIESIVKADAEKWTDETIPKALVEEGLDRPVAVLRWPADTELPTTKSRTEFYTAVSAHGITLPEVSYAVLVRGESFHAFFLWKDDDTVTAISIIPPQPSHVRLDEGHAALSARRVAIVGCGSLGGKLAVMLARSGVGRFLLVDDDVMLPDNVIRHELDWREIGTHKVDGIARRIGLVSPSAQCDVRQYKLGGQQSSGSIESLIDTLAECDLVIDASADARVFNYLCAAVGHGKKPLLWAEVFGGGIGGLVVRHRPGHEPAPAAMRAAIEQWCADKGKPIERVAEDYETRSSGPPLIADDADVTVIAAHAARLAIDTLIPREPSIFPNSIYMIGLAAGWIFDQPFETHPIDIGHVPVKAPEPVDPSVVEEERAHVLKLFKNFSDATASQSSDNPPA